MPLRLAERVPHLPLAAGDQGQHHYDHQQRTSETHSHAYDRAGTTSAPTSASTTRSSLSSSAVTSTMSSSLDPKPPVSRRQRLSQMADNTSSTQHGFSQEPSSVAAKTAHRRNHSGQDTVTPTASIQEWAHQVHVQQRRIYDWCSECCPKTEPLQVPSEDAIRRVRVQEPTHCYE